MQLIRVARIKDAGNSRCYYVQLPTQFQAGSVWKATVKNIKIELTALRKLQRFSHSRCCHYFVIFLREQDAEHLGRIQMIVDTKNAALNIWHLREPPTEKIMQLLKSEIMNAGEVRL